MSYTTEMTKWIEDPAGIDPDAGDVGGDDQAGPAVSRRWHGNHGVAFDGPTLARLPHGYEPETVLELVVTAYWYPIEIEGEGFGVCRELEHILCTDPTSPGVTEVWGDSTYTELTDRFATAELAYAAAGELAATFDAAQGITWQGDLTL